MPTLRQKKLADALIANSQASKPLNAGELLENVGYSKSIAEQPKRVIEAPGVQEELAKRGFNPETAREVVGEILIAGENDNAKLKAADMIFKVHGSYAAEKHLNVNVEVESSSEIKELTAHLNGIYRGTGVPSDGGSPRALDTQIQD